MRTYTSRCITCGELYHGGDAKRAILTTTEHADRNNHTVALTSRKDTHGTLVRRDHTSTTSATLAITESVAATRRREVA